MRVRCCDGVLYTHVLYEFETYNLVSVVDGHAFTFLVLLCCFVGILSLFLVTLRRHRAQTYYVLPSSSQQVPIMSNSKGKCRVYGDDTVSLM